MSADRFAKGVPEKISGSFLLLVGFDRMRPEAFYSTIAAGARALLTEENRLRKLSCNGDPRVLLALRDVSGLRGRLDHANPDSWKDGWGITFISGQDIGVLNELAERYGESPYRDQGGSPF